MSPNEIACFDPLCPSPLPAGMPFVDFDDFDCRSFDDSSSMIRVKQRFRTSPKYFYIIGNYESSSFYREFLSDEPVCAPNGRMVLVRTMSDETSHNPRSSFRSLQLSGAFLPRDGSS